MSTSSANTRSRAFHWNAGGWFGSLFGMTAWMIVAVILLVPAALRIALLVAVFAALPHAAGLILWRRRARLSPYRAFQIALVVGGLCSAAAVRVIERNGLWQQVQGVGTVSARVMYIAIAAAVVALLALFWALERRGSRA